MQDGRRWGMMAVGAGLLSLFSGFGCHWHQYSQIGPQDALAPVTVPPPGTVPTELGKVTLPPYVIEAPDVLLVEVVQRSQIPDPDLEGQKKWVTERLPIQPITGQFPVHLDGSIRLGAWGSVPIAGLTLDQAAEAVRKHVVDNPVLRDLGTKPESIIVILDILAYNSKKYYVIYDGAGFGEQVVPIPITGSETVLDAIATVGGLSEVASKRNIWVARRTPHPGQPWQILPVDWIGLTQHGVTNTNYQVFPGDRIYVKAQKLVTIDRAMARILSPVERVFGVTLLGANTINQIGGRGFGFNGNGN